MEICSAIHFHNFATDLRLIRYHSFLLQRCKKRKKDEMRPEGQLDLRIFARSSPHNRAVMSEVEHKDVRN